jgi:hypothetical protein
MSDQIVHVGRRHIQIVADVAGNPLKPCESSDARTRLRGLMESGDAVSQALNLRSIEFAAPQPIQQSRLLRQALHLHRPFDCFALAAEVQAVSAPRHRHDSAVNRRGQSAIETDFLRAKMAASLQGAKVEESQGHRLLDLVSVPPRQKDHGDVRLANLNFAGRFGVRRRARQRFDQAGKVHRVHLSFKSQSKARANEEESLAALRTGEDGL